MRNVWTKAREIDEKMPSRSIISFLIAGENESGLRMSRGTADGRQSISSTQTCRNSLDFRSRKLSRSFLGYSNATDVNENKVNNKLRKRSASTISVRKGTPSYSPSRKKERESEHDRDARFWWEEFSLEKDHSFFQKLITVVRNVLLSSKVDSVIFFFFFTRERNILFGTTLFLYFLCPSNSLSLLRVSVRTCLYIYIYMCVCVCARFVEISRALAPLYIYIYICMYICTSMYVCMYIHVVDVRLVT